MIASGETTAAEIADYSRVIVEATDRLAGIVRQLLDFARPRELCKARHDLVELARRTLQLLTPLAAKRKVALTMTGNLAPVETDVDAGQFQQVLTNLTMNAVQAMPAAGEVQVHIATERARPPDDLVRQESEYVRVAVRDTGVGMTAEQIQHIFDPFYTTKEVGDGTGLGLSVAYGITREHGGWIAVQSEMGKGSEFAVYLPREILA
jgi:signal transduction histidine kinase